MIALAHRSTRRTPRLTSRAGASIVAATMLVAAGCSRPPEPQPEAEEVGPESALTAYTIAAGERRYELNTTISGTIKPGAAFTAAFAPTVTGPVPDGDPGRRDLPFTMDVTANLRTEIVPEGDGSRITMRYETVDGTVSVAGVPQAVTPQTLRQIRGEGGGGFSYHLGGDGTVSDLRNLSGVAVPARATSGALGCPRLPPGGAEPDQDWKTSELVSLAGLDATMVATNGYRLEGDNSAFVKSSIDSPVDAVADVAALAAQFPALASVLGAAVATPVRAVGEAVSTSTCELTWPDQELLAATSTGRWALALSTAGAAEPLPGALGAGEFLRLDIETETELRSV